MADKGYKNMAPSSGAGSDDESSESEEEDDDKDKCVWKYTTNESIYDLAVLRICDSGSSSHQDSCSNFFRIFKLIVLLACNCALQGVVVARVYTLVRGIRAARVGEVFAEASSGGNCFRRKDLTLYNGYARKPIGLETGNWDCGPLWPLLMSNVTFLDVNGDGIWSLADNLTDLEEEHNAKFGKDGDLLRIFNSLLMEARWGSYRIQIEDRIDSKSSQAATSNFTEIPMQWLHKQEPIFTLCNNVNVFLCGNMELRGILAEIFPWLEDTNHRVRECRKVWSWCARVFGELYLNYVDVIDDACEDKFATWAAVEMVTVYRYGKADRYKGEICSTTYETFLLLVLLIWWLTILSEVRECSAAIFAILTYHEAEGSTVVERGKDGKITVQSMSKLVKFYIMLLVLVPRFLIVVTLAVIGNDFLIVTDNYNDLILNSVALGFLIDIDEFLFKGVATEGDKDDIANLNEMEAPCSFPGHQCWIGCCTNHTSMLYLVGVCSVSISMVVTAYYLPYGKADLEMAYQCLCHEEGSHCVVAQLLGHNMTVPYFVSGSNSGGHGRAGKR